jgi:hypothetical protein
MLGQTHARRTHARARRHRLLALGRTAAARGRSSGLMT